MDELLWGKDLEDVFDWVKRLQMATKFVSMMRRSFSRLLNLIYKERPMTGTRN
jgi:hypothetical protein